jgi:hypothetical protein
MTFPGTLPTDIDVDGDYDYWAAFGGLSLSGERKFDTYTLVPRVGAHLTYADGGTANFTASIPGFSEQGQIMIGDQNSLRFIGELGFYFGDGDGTETSLATVRNWYVTPGVFCDNFTGLTSETTCGTSLDVEFARTETATGNTLGYEVGVEGTDSTVRATGRIFYERNILQGNGTLKLDAGIGEGGEPTTGGTLDFRF